MNWLLGKVEPYLFWLKLAGAAALLVGAFLGGMKVEAGLIAERDLSALQAAKADADVKQGVIDTLALAVRAQGREADERALKLTQEVRNAKGKLAECRGDGSARLTGEFVRLYDLTLQAERKDRPEPAGAAGGAADPGDVLELEAENGRRWKKCRDRYNALIDAVK